MDTPINYHDLLEAISANDLAKIKQFVEQNKETLDIGQRFNYKNFKNAIIFHIIAFGSYYMRPQILQFLLETYADKLKSSPEILNAKDACENTAVHWAAMAGNLKHVELLVMYGADPNTMNFLEHTPLDLLKNTGHGAYTREMEKIISDRFELQRRLLQQQEVAKRASELQVTKQATTSTQPPVSKVAHTYFTNLLNTVSSFWRKHEGYTQLSQDSTEEECSPFSSMKKKFE